MEKLIKNTTIKTYCLRHCYQGTPKRAVHAEGGAVSIHTKVKYENTDITDARNHRHVITSLVLGLKLSPRRQVEIFVPSFNLCTQTEAVVVGMSFQGNQGEVAPLVGVGHEIPGADNGSQVVQLT